jgi:hypothetical protein
MRLGTLVITNGKAALYRKESFNGRTTAQIEWIVRVGEQIMRCCNTKREATIWLNIYKD